MSGAPRVPPPDEPSAAGARSASDGLPLRIEQVRISRAHRGEDAGWWVSSIVVANWVRSSSLLKQDGASWVRRASMMGREVVVKCREIDGVWSRLKCALGRGKGDRHWRGAAMLAGKGVKTARVLVLARARVDGRECELLVMEWVEGATLLRVMADVHSASESAPGVRAQHAIARAVGEQIAGMEELFNRDHKPSNLIVERWTASAAYVAIIDCEGVRRATIPGAARMFASLVIESTGCGVRPRRALMMRAVRSYVERAIGLNTPDDSPVHRPRTISGLARGGGNGGGEYRVMRRMVWDDAARVVAHHGDPRPKVNPLANPGGAIDE